MDEHTFIGFDCAYRTLGWCILGYNPRALTKCISSRLLNVEQIKECANNLFHLRASGVVDVLGANIDEVDHSTRAIRLSETLRRIIPREIIENATVIIERQPRKRGRGFIGGRAATVHDSNQTVESQLVYQFSAITPAKKVYLVSAGKKNAIACTLLCEERVKSYAARKKQSRRAFVCLAQLFDFNVCPIAHEIRHVKADQADACVQIVAAIILCGEYI